MCLSVPLHTLGTIALGSISNTTPLSFLFTLFLQRITLALNKGLQQVLEALYQGPLFNSNLSDTCVWFCFSRISTHFISLCAWQHHNLPGSTLLDSFQFITGTRVRLLRLSRNQQPTGVIIGVTPSGFLQIRTPIPAVALRKPHNVTRLDSVSFSFYRSIVRVS